MDREPSRPSECRQEYRVEQGLWGRRRSAHPETIALEYAKRTACFFRADDCVEKATGDAGSEHPFLWSSASACRTKRRPTMSPVPGEHQCRSNSGPAYSGETSIREPW